MSPDAFDGHRSALYRDACEVSMNQYVNFTSLPPEQEASFVVYEQQMAESEKKGFTIGAIAGGAFLIVALGIYLGVAPDERDLGKDMNMSNLTKTREAPAEKAAEKPAAAPAAPAEAPAEKAPE
jgi:hypothetical protein